MTDRRSKPKAARRGRIALLLEAQPGLDAAGVKQELGLKENLRTIERDLATLTTA